MPLEPEQDRLRTHHDLAAWLILIKVRIFLSLVLSLLFFWGVGLCVQLSILFWLRDGVLYTLITIYYNALTYLPCAI